MLRKGVVVSVDAVQGDWVRLEQADNALAGVATATGAAAVMPSFKSGGAGGGAGGGGLPDNQNPDKYGGGWMLTDGKALKLGTLLKPHVVDLPAGTKWQVTRDGGCVGYAQPGGRAANPSDSGRQLAGCTEGASVEVSGECGLWCRVVAEDGPAWVDMDAFFAG